MKKSHFHGFTLIELMIVVVLIAIIAAIAIPAYQGYTEQARRADAKSGLLSLQLAQEKFRANCRFYAGNIVMPPGNDVCGASPAASSVIHDTTSPDDHYNLSITNASTASYTLTATRNPSGKQANDTKCGNFIIIQPLNGLLDYDVTGSLSKTECWQR